MKVAQRDRAAGEPAFEPGNRGHLEVAMACKALSRCGWDDPEIAGEVRVPEREVGAYLMLAGAPATVRSRVLSGELDACSVLRTLHEKGPAGLEGAMSRPAPPEDQPRTLMTSESSRRHQQTNTWRLLNVLESQGEKDADQLEALTGIRKPIIVSTLYTAMGRGQVRCTPKGVWLRDAGLLKEDAKAPRGQVYAFVSYDSQPNARSDVDEKADVQGRLEVMEALLFKPGLMKMVSRLDLVCQTRKVSLVGFH